MYKSPMYKSITTIICLLSFLAQTTGLAADFYVNDSTGNDSWDGTSPTFVSGTTGPKLTIQGGLTAALNWTGTSHTVNVAAGTYDGSNNRGLTFGEAMTVIGEKPNSTSWSTIIDCDSAARAFTVDADVTIEGFSIQEGSASDGGGLYWTNADVIIKECEIKDCEATGTGQTGNGGGIFCSGGSATIENSLIWTCHAAAGGGLHLTLNDGNSDEYDLVMRDCEIEQNWASDYGSEYEGAGGIYVGDGNPSGTIEALIMDSTISDNDVTGGAALGGGVYDNSGGNLTILRCTISGNEVKYGSGGGIFGSPLIRDSLISGNKCPTGSGGGIDGSATVVNCKISENEAQSGAGISGASPSISNSLLWSNVAKDYGGGICASDITSTDYPTTIVNTIVAENKVTGYSGMTYAPYGGGAIGNVRWTFTNCVFYGNDVSSTYWSSYGGGVYGLGNFYNSIIWSNTATFGKQIVVDGSSKTMLFNYNDVQSGTNWSYVVAGSIAWTYNIAADDPDFEDPADCDFHLTSVSPCIDVGWNDAPAIPGTDMDGYLRIANGGLGWTVDMGAYEYDSTPWSFNDMARDSSDNLGMQWTSVSTTGQQYVVYYTHDDFSESMEWTIAATVNSGGSSTRWTHTSVPSTGEIYYKVMDKTTGVFTYDVLGAIWIDVYNGKNMISSPFEPYPSGGGEPGESTLDAIIGGQLTGHPAVRTLSDNIEIWDNAAEDYVRAWYKIGTGWVEWNSPYGDPEFGLDADVGYWINRVLSHADTTILLFGRVAVDSNRTISIATKKNLVGYCYPMGIDLDDTDLVNDGFIGHAAVQTLSDNIEFWSNSASDWERFWYQIGTGFVEWSTFPVGGRDPEVLVGDGFYVNLPIRASGFTWTEPVPYSVPPNEIPTPGNN